MTRPRTAREDPRVAVEDLIAPHPAQNEVRATIARALARGHEGGRRGPDVRCAVGHERPNDIAPALNGRQANGNDPERIAELSKVGAVIARAGEAPGNGVELRATGPARCRDRQGQDGARIESAAHEHGDPTRTLD